MLSLYRPHMNMLKTEFDTESFLVGVKTKKSNTYNLYFNESVVDNSPFCKPIYKINKDDNIHK